MLIIQTCMISIYISKSKLKTLSVMFKFFALPASFFVVCVWEGGVVDVVIFFWKCFLLLHFCTVPYYHSSFHIARFE